MTVQEFALDFVLLVIGIIIGVYLQAFHEKRNYKTYCVRISFISDDLVLAGVVEHHVEDGVLIVELVHNNCVMYAPWHWIGCDTI